MPPASRKSTAARKSRGIDPIKQMLCNAVQHHLVSRDQNPPPLLPAPDNVIEVVAYSISPTQTQVKVKTTDQGTRYFTVKLSENY